MRIATQTQPMTRSDSNKKWQKTLDDIQYLKQAVNPRFLLEYLGFKVVHETKKELRGPCAVHGGDNKTSFRFNKITRTWICFSHKCNEQFGYDIIGLIRSKTGKSFLEAVDFLKELVGDINSSAVNEFKRNQEKESFIGVYTDLESCIDKRVTEGKLKILRGFLSDYFINKGYAKETLETFEIGGGYADKYDIVREVIPIRNANGILLAYALRDKRDNTSEYKYIFTEGFVKDNVLYNLYESKQYLKNLPLILVEGYKSVWKLWQCGIKNVAAVMGSTITQGQQDLIYTYAQNGVVLMFDNDMPGIKGTLSAAKLLKRKVNVNAVLMVEFDDNGIGLDPSDLSCEQLYGYLKNYI